MLQPPGHPGKSSLSAALLVAAAGMMWSFSGIFVRAAPHLDAWQFLCWRAGGIGLAFSLIDRLARRAPLHVRLRALGWSGLAAALLLAGAFVSFILSIQNTSVANTLFIYSLAPIVAAIMAYLILGERVSRRMMLAILLGLAGLGIMMYGEMTGGSWFGYSMAFVPVLLFSAYAVMQRAFPARDFSAAVSGFAVIVVVLSMTVVFAKGEPLLPSLAESGAAFTNGLVMGLGFMLFQRGARHVPVTASCCWRKPRRFLARCGSG